MPVTASIRTTQYTVSCLPETDVNYRLYAITVEYLPDDDNWMVHRNGECLGADGTWDEHTKPFGRGDAWLANHRFTEDTARALALAAAPAVAAVYLTTTANLAARRKDAA